MPITNFDKVELLLPMTGANNGTVFTDYSLRKRTVTRTGVVTSTSQSKFSSYGSSGYSPGTSGHNIEVAHASSLNLAGKDFCYEVHMRFVALPGTGEQQGLISKWTNTSGVYESFFAYWNDNGTRRLRFAYSLNGTAVAAEAEAITLPTNEWVHLGVFRHGNTLQFFTSGGYLGAGKAISGSIYASSAPIRLFAVGNVSSTTPNGFMQDACITIGDSKYAGGYSEPSRMTQRTLTRTNTGTDSHEYDRAVLFDFNGGAHVGRHTTVIPDNDGNFEATDLIDLEYGVAFIRDGCSPVCRGPVEVDADA